MPHCRLRAVTGPRNLGPVLRGYRQVWCAGRKVGNADLAAVRCDREIGDDAFAASVKKGGKPKFTARINYDGNADFAAVGGVRPPVR